MSSTLVKDSEPTCTPTLAPSGESQSATTAPLPPEDGAPQSITAAQRDGAVQAFLDAAEALAAVSASRVARVERDLVALARAIATRVVSKELTTDPSILVALARDGLEALSEREHVTVRFAADVGEELRAYLTTEIRQRAPHCTIVFDADLTDGSCVVESAQGYVDESVGARLDVVMEQLGFGHGGSLSLRASSPRGSQ